MKQSRRKLADHIAAQTLKHGSSRRLSKQIAAYLMAERRTSELDSLMRDVQADWATAGYIEVVARSAHVLPAGVISDIKQRAKQIYPQARKITVTSLIDPEVIGGVQLELANKRLDLSVEAKLNKFKQLTTAGKD